MKQFIFLLLMALSTTIYSQNNVTTVNTIKPKLGQKMAFEAAYKQHVAKFHKGDEKIATYEIMSGTYAGYYHLVNSGGSMADFDKERADAMAHNLDLDKNYFPMLEKTMNGYYRRIDSLSFQSDSTATKFLVNLRHIKSSMQEDYRNETRRSVLILGKLKGKFWERLSNTTFDMMWDGSDPVVVTIRNLSDGFASLESNFYGAGNTGNPTFKDEYVKAYGTLDWDKRVKLMEDAVVSNEQYIMRLRKDLSSQ